MIAKEMKGNHPKHHAGRALREPSKCSETGSGFIMGGPFWSGSLHDSDFVTDVLQIVQVVSSDHLQMMVEVYIQIF